LFVLAYGRLYLLNDVQYLIVMTSANKIKVKTQENVKIYETIKPTKLTSTNAKLYERRTLTLAKDKQKATRSSATLIKNYSISAALL